MNGLKLQDALYNWLQIKLVSDARPIDQAARDTLDFFEQILREDHHLSSFQIAQIDETMIHVQYEQAGTTKRQMFDREYAGQLLTDITANPKYND